jgi:alpha-L-fucosidase
MTRRSMLTASAQGAAAFALLRPRRAWAQPEPASIHVVSDAVEPMCRGPFEPSWASLEQFETPEWFRNAKFGIWAHWGPQCAPERGDWYARHMYAEGHWQYQAHLEAYGHPSKVGFKDVIHRWKAENWDPERLVDLYKRAGAQYFFAMANHHDNLDLWNSRHHAWNSVRVGPQKDIIAGWARAARGQGLKFGVSVHAAHAWRWYETAQGADRRGPLAGVPYDGKLTAADGQGQWWEGLDPQQLYAQNHPLSRNSSDLGSIGGQWAWDNGAVIPDLDYCQRFYDRTVDLINQHQPDVLYFDDTALPLWPISDAGLKIAAHYYNDSIRRNNGQLAAVLNGKVLDPQQRKCMVWDIERGASNVIEPEVWQTDTCLGGWHYDRGVFDRREYKTAGVVIRMLVDIVSKNGNLLLNVPVRGDGTIDEQEEEIISDVGRWMEDNSEAILGTRPWKVLGEGPALGDAAPLQAQGFNEGKGKPLTAADVRYTAKSGVIYAITLGAPKEQIRLSSLGTRAGLIDGQIRNVELLGGRKSLKWSSGPDALTIDPPAAVPSEHAVVFRIALHEA